MTQWDAARLQPAGPRATPTVRMRWARPVAAIRDTSGIKVDKRTPDLRLKDSAFYNYLLKRSLRSMDNGQHQPRISQF